MKYRNGGFRILQVYDIEIDKRRDFIMEWKYVKKLVDKTCFENIENTYAIKLPQCLKDLILEYNGGRPNKICFDTKNSKEIVMQGLISYNKDDKGNIYVYDEIFKKGYIPFAITEFGDVICININNQNIELYLHELGDFEFICNDLSEFIKDLDKEDLQDF